MGAPFTDKVPSERSAEKRLESWKEIAAYLKRDVTTVQRWEKREGMPVHRHLHDKRGSVYALRGELDAWVRGRQPVPEPEETRAAEEPVRDDADRAQGSATRKWVVFGTVAVSLVLIAAAYVLSRGHRAKGQSKIQSLAVLPLKNLSGDSTQEYFADGMTEAIIGKLAMIRGLRVISRTSVMRFKDTNTPIPEIAKTLGVDALVEGSVIREGGRVRVHAQLIRAASDDHFWSQDYDREISDVLLLQSEIAQAIAAKVEVTLSGGERARLVAARAVSPEVYESFLKGQFSQGYTQGDVEKAIAYFEDALHKDPNFAPAYLGLADAYAQLGTAGISGAPPAEVRPKVMSAIQKALELDPNLSQAHAQLAGVYRLEWKWRDAEAEYKIALDLDPNNAAAHLGYAGWLACEGRAEEAIVWARRARELDPLGITGNSMGWLLFMTHHYEESIQELKSDVAVHPEDGSTYWFLGFALIANDQAKEAIPVLEKAVALSQRSPAVMGVLIRAYAHAGRRAEGLGLLAELRQRQKRGYVNPAAFVNAYLGLGDNEKALAALEQAYAGQSSIIQFVKVHPYMDPLRGDPRFQDLVRRVGLN